MSTPIRTFASYLPRHIVSRLAKNPAPPDAPRSEQFSAAVFFADIAGFTNLTERLARQGPAGAEQLTDVLNAYFGKLIDIVLSHRGDVAKFAGDALLAIWKAADPTDDLAEVTLRSAQAGLAVQEALRGYEAEGERLALRINIASGEIRTFEVGGVFGRWEWLMGGVPSPKLGIRSNKHRSGTLRCHLTPGS